jgi:hypothetical protein
MLDRWARLSRGAKIAIVIAVVVGVPAVAGQIAQAGKHNSPDSKPAASRSAVVTSSPSSTPSSAPVRSKAPATKAPTSISPSDPAIVDAAFVGVARSGQPSLSAYADADIAASGRQVCSDIRSGTTVRDEADLLALTYGPKGGGEILGLAPEAYCKNLSAKITAGIQALG